MLPQHGLMSCARSVPRIQTGKTLGRWSGAWELNHSVRGWLLLSLLKDTFSQYKIPGWLISFPSILKMLFYCLLPFIFVEKSLSVLLISWMLLRFSFCVWFSRVIVDETRCDVLYIYPVSYLFYGVFFFNLWLNVFLQFWKIPAPYPFKYWLHTFLFLLFLWGFNYKS